MGANFFIAVLAVGAVDLGLIVRKFIVRSGEGMGADFLIAVLAIGAVLLGLIVRKLVVERREDKQRKRR